jgi:hypothetical protein
MLTPPDFSFTSTKDEAKPTQRKQLQYPLKWPQAVVSTPAPQLIPMSEAVRCSSEASKHLVYFVLALAIFSN